MPTDPYQVAESGPQDSQRDGANLAVERSVNYPENTGKHLSLANDAAFNMNMLKKFPNASLTKEFYRQNVLKNFM